MSESGAPGIGEVLEGLGVRHAFGLPGTQNVSLFEALRTSSIRTILATSELAASFMAVGYARASGRAGVLLTIPGPGLTYATAGLAEARLDSVPLLHLVVQRPMEPGKRFRHQEIPHRELLAPLVKEIVEIESARELGGALSSAWRTALDGEPGPVVAWIASGALERHAYGERSTEDFAFSGTPLQRRFTVPGLPHPSAEASAVMPDRHTASPERTPSGELQELAERFRRARRPVLFLGLGSVAASDGLEELVRHSTMPFFTTPSARGTLPEDHPFCLDFDFDRGGLSVLNELLQGSDLVLALGCKLGHNGTGGFGLKLPAETLVHVNTDPRALGANYSTSLSLCRSVEDAVEALVGALDRSEPAGWTGEEIAAWRSRIAKETLDRGSEPSFLGEESPGVRTGGVGGLIEILRQELPRDGIVVTDSGLHQAVVRRHLRVFAPRGLIFPSDFQSMGFGLPAAVGASLAAPQRRVVAVIGDGGLAMSGMELLTLAREGLPVTVFVFNDGHLNLIRLQQERDFGYGHAVRLRNPDMEAFAAAMGVGYVCLDTAVRERVRAALSEERPVLVDVPLADSREMRSARRTARAKAWTRKAVGQGRLEVAKRILNRFRR